LREIAKDHNDYACYDLGEDRPPVKLFNKQFKEKVIQQNACNYDDKIPKQLDPFFCCCLLPHHVPAQIKSGWKSNAK